MIKVNYIDHMGSDLTIVNAARVSFNKTSDSLEERDTKLIKYLAEHDHLSPFEHCSISFMIECPLYIRSQIQRHRTFSYNEISRRYTSEDLVFYTPKINDIRQQSKSNRQASEKPIGMSSAIEAQSMINDLHEKTLKTYNSLLSMGVCREQARGVLPQNLMTKFYMTGNLRNIAHFLQLRLHEGAQSEVRDVANQMLEIAKQYFPVSISTLMTM